MKRRSFLGTAALLGLPAATLAGTILRPHPNAVRRPGDDGDAVVVSTWNFAGASEAAIAALDRGQSPLDAVEAGIRVTEADASNTSVGIGGHPDRDGHLTLDASIMEGSGRCGSVVFMEGIDHPISVARLVMEKSPHVILAGEGAARFAQEHGYSLSKG